jgi:glycosyltransferase involved in cell wall biosynthesis
MIKSKNNHQKNICLIGRSIYPYPISKHSQNMRTFQGWSIFWKEIVLVCQCSSKKIQKSQYKNIYGVLIPFISNKYLNMIYFTFVGFFELKKLVKRHNFEVYQASDPGGAFLALIMSKLYKKKFIMEIQGDIFNYPSQVGTRFHTNLVKFFSRFFAKKADFIRIVSPFLFQPLEKLNIERNKIFLISARCDSQLFNINNVNSNKPKFFDKNQFNLLFVGNLLINKGVYTLLEAFSLIEKENPNIGLFFVGDGEEKEALIAKSKEFGLEKKVNFLGRVNYEEIPTLMHYSDILILPSFHEGFGRVLLEAMSMHLPIIASNVGGIPFVINDRNDGLLFEAGDIESLKANTLFLINNPDISRKMTENANEKFLKEYEYDISMKKFIGMYQTIFEI